MICIRKDCLKDKEQTIKDNIDIIHSMKIKKLSITKDSRTKHTLHYLPSLKESNAMYITVLVQSLQAADTKKY